MSRKNPTPLQLAALGLYAYGMDHPHTSWTDMGPLFGVAPRDAGKCVGNVIAQFGLPRYRKRRDHDQSAVESCRNALRALMAEVSYTIPQPMANAPLVVPTKKTPRDGQPSAEPSAEPTPTPAPELALIEEDLSGLSVADLMERYESAASDVQELQSMLSEAQNRATAFDAEIRRRLDALRAGRR